MICTRKNPNLVGNKFLIVNTLEKTEDTKSSRIVAVDNVGAGIGEIVLLVTGSAARIGSGNENSPVDACVVGIVDDPHKIVIDD